MDTGAPEGTTDGSGQRKRKPEHGLPEEESDRCKDRTDPSRVDDMQIGALLAAIDGSQQGNREESEEKAYIAMVCAVAPTNQAAADRDQARNRLEPVAEEDSPIDDVPMVWCPWKEYRDTLTGAGLDKAEVEAAMAE